MSDTSNLHTVTTDQTGIERPLSQTATTSSTNSTTIKARSSSSPTEPCATLSSRSNNSASPTRMPPRTRSRSPAPDPAPASPRTDSYQEDYLQRTESPAQMSPSSPTSPTSNRRSASYGSRKSSNEDRRRYDNTVYHYGRHSNYWLFGGFSVRDTVRDGVDWVRQRGKKS